MGKLKKAKKFRKNHLKDKVDHSRKLKKHNDLTARKSKNGGAVAAPDSEKNGFSVPAQPDLAILNEPGFEKYLSDSENAENSDDEDVSDDDLAAEEEAAYLAGADDDEDEDETPAEASTVTRKQVKEWAEGLEKSARPIKHIIRAFANEESVLDETAFEELIRLALGPLPSAIRRELPLGPNKTPIQSKKFTDLTGALKLYSQSLTELLKNGTNKRIKVILSATQKVLPYLLSLRKLVKDMVKALTSIIINPDVDDLVKMDAFSVIREAATSYPNALLELFLTTNYENLVRLCANTNAYNLPTINFAKNLFAMLYNVDPTVGYQTSFKQVRTLALHLKASLDKIKNPDTALNVIYTWQYVQSLDFFSRVISLAADESTSSPLLQLIHPLVQVTLRTSTLVPSATFFPLRFYLIRSLIRLARHTGVYIPVAPALLEVLGSSALNKKGKKSSLKQFDFDTNIRVPQSYADTAVYQNGLSDELVDVFAEAFVLYAKSIAFPELAGPVVVSLKRYMKRSTNGRLNKQLQQLVERFQANSEYISKARQNVTFGPRDKEQVAAFLKDIEWEKTPLGSFVVVRRKVREERIRLLADSKDSEDDAVEGLSDLENQDDEDEDEDVEMTDSE